MEDKKDLFKSILLSDLDDNISIYKNIGYHISLLKKDQILKDESLITILEKLEEIFAFLKLLEFKIEEDNLIGTEKFKIYNSELGEIRDKLKIIILSIGYNQISEIFKLCMSTYDYENYNSIINSDIRFIDKYFIIHRVVIHNLDIDDLDKNFNLLMQFIENKDPVITPSFFYVLNCCSLTVKIGAYNFTFDGYFKQDSLNSLFKEKSYVEKYNKLYRCVGLLNIPYKFKHGYLSQLAYTDFTIKSADEIISLITNSYEELKKISKTLMSNLITDFVRLDRVKQRKIIILLLLSKEEDHIVANILFENVRSSDMRDTLDWSIRKLLTESSGLKMAAKKKLLGFDSNEMTWEEKLIILKTSEKNKSKALAKVKELGSSKESSSKAETYLNGFYKIPFGIYKEEEIFTLTSIIKNKFVNLINLINDYQEFIPYELECEFDYIRKFIDNKSYLPCVNKLNYLVEAICVYNESGLHLKTSEFLKINEIKDSITKLIDDILESNSKKQKYLLSVREILDSAIYGQFDVKNQIEVIFAQWMNGKTEGAVIGLQGPPGTGKTQIAREGIAKCLVDSDGSSRPFCFVPLGGARDGTILEGHGYTYLGSQWGKLVDLLMDSKCMNPIIFFDEVDKVSTTDYGRDIINILIHLTDPTQNKEIYDKYFSGVELDFSKCIFIFSYNDPQAIDRVLRDRITEIKVKPLTLEEKITIVKNYSLPQICENVGIDHSTVIFSNESIEYLIDIYTFEAGMRKCIEKLKEILREINLQQIKNPSFIKTIINQDFIDSILSRHNKLIHKQIHPNPEIGLVNGLYATGAGIGGITVIQIIKTLSDKKLGLELTGSQGNVMKESMICAKTLAWNLLPFDIKKSINQEWESIGSFGFHIHCPECATPKDGPSAGIAITTALYSVLTSKPVRNNIAMTGEVDLIGNVKAIGGLDSKISGAIKAGCTKVLIPLENKQDYLKLSDHIKKSIEIILVDKIQDVLDLSLVDEKI